MKTRTLKLLGLLLAAALLVCGVIGLSASAEESGLKIDSANVAYNDMMHLAFTLANTDALPDGAEAGIIIWKDAQAEYTVGNSSYRTFADNVDGDTVYYKSYGIAAPEIGAQIYVAACYKLDGAVTIAETPFAYSIVDYLTKRLGENVTDVQAELYANVLTYGAASDTVLSEDSFVLVRANGGYVGGFNRAVGAAKEIGTSFTLRAPITNVNGDYFTKWVNKAGETVSTERVCTVTPENAGISAYTAVYGSDSDYKFGFGFEDLATGEVAFTTPDLSKLTSTTCYNGYSKSNMRRWSIKSTGLENISMQFYAIPKATLTSEVDEDGNKIFEFEKDENGNYVMGLKDSAFVSEKANGDKAMTIVRGINKAAGYDATFTNTALGCKTVEVDCGYEKITYDGVQNYFFVYVYDGTEGASYRFNLSITHGSNEGYVYAEKSTGGAQSDNKFQVNGEVSKYTMNPGEMTTFSIALNTTGEAPAFDLYLNGEFAGSLPCSLFGAHNANIDFSTARIGSLKIGAVSAAENNMIFDNISFK